MIDYDVDDEIRNKKIWQWNVIINIYDWLNIFLYEINSIYIIVFSNHMIWNS